jgi:Zn-finger nucleic acid-binding protein
MPFRTATLHCPRCRTIELTTSDELRHCASCKGSWVPHEVLAEHVSTMQVDVEPKLVWEISNARLGLPCAACAHRMEPLRLFDVPVDRCHSHGVWFDDEELATVLRHSAAHVEPKPEDDGGSAVALDIAAGAGEIALEVGVGVVGVVLEVVLGALGELILS